MNLRTLSTVQFGEMELSNITYWGIILTGAIFLISFGLASLPLAQNLKKEKKAE